MHSRINLIGRGRHAPRLRDRRQKATPERAPPPPACPTRRNQGTDITTTSNGFIVTVEQTPTIPATALKEGDTFALVGNDSPLTIRAKQRHLQPLWLLDLEGHDSPITLRDDEPIRPLRMLRAFNLTCQLCTRTRRHVLDLPVHGIPQTWICDQH